MVKRANRSNRPKFRPGVECLEQRELLSTLMEGLAANDLSGSSVAPVGNIFDDATSGLVGDDFAISAPGARGRAGDVYIIFGGPQLDPQPPARPGCINPPMRVTNCTLIDTYLTTQTAVRILGARGGDEFGFAVAGVGDAIGDSRPDVLVGAPFALNSSLESSGRAYLIGGEVIAKAISDARLAGGTTVATIDLSAILPTQTIRVFDGETAGDQAGTSVAGLGLGNFIVGAPKNGPSTKIERGAAYVFESLRGVTGSGLLVPNSIVRGPSLLGHLGGVPAEELTATGFRGYSVSGLRNPALIPVASEVGSVYDLIGGLEPDALVGAPDACVDNACQLATDARHGRAYLLSGTALITVCTPILPCVYDLASNADLVTLHAIPVEGAENGDRFGSAVSSAGNLDGDLDNGDEVSDFMIGAPNQDIGQLTNAGAVYVVFGREVVDAPFPDDTCLIDPTRSTDLPQNFRQCIQNGLITPLDAANFSRTGNTVGLILQGEVANERAGMALADAGNYVDPSGRSALTTPSRVGVNEIMIGAPFRDVTVNGVLTPGAGRAYVLFGTKDFVIESGRIINLGQIAQTQQGQVFDGREANAHYGISVNGAGNVFDPIGMTGNDILIGANQADVTLNNAVAANVGETELVFGSTGGTAGGLFPLGPLPFVQPGTFGPQIFVGGFWSFNNAMPPAGSVVEYPLIPNRAFPDNPTDPTICQAAVIPAPPPGVEIPVWLCPPATEPMFPPGSVGPFVAAWPLGAPIFIPGHGPSDPVEDVLENTRGTVAVAAAAAHKISHRALTPKKSKRGRLAAKFLS